MIAFPHGYAFDPSYGYTLQTLLEIGPPEEPPDFADFWQERYARVSELDPQPVALAAAETHPDLAIQDLSYLSTDWFPIGGWLVTPLHEPVRRGLVVGHGYGGRDGPDLDLPIRDAAVLFPCFRGLSRSRRAPISDNPAFHVLHDIQSRDRYILGNCVEDLWMAVSTLLALYPEVEGHVGYMGISFGGGIGALALPWDARIQRAHLNVPTFGHHPLRLQLPSSGSGESVREYAGRHPHVVETLRYYDAATAARYIRAPMHVAAALFDGVVPPPGQFAVYNALAGPKRLFVLDAGHFDYPAKAEQERQLGEDLREFFEPL